jgi:hypothetical protein
MFDFREQSPLNCNGKEIGARTITVSEARPHAQRAGSSTGVRSLRTRFQPSFPAQAAHWQRREPLIKLNENERKG